MSRTYHRPSRGRLRRRSRMCSSLSPAGLCAMSETVVIRESEERAIQRPPGFGAGRPERRRPERGFKNSSMAQLTLVRFREFIREPEAVFWTFVFPILLAAGLGIAFRQRGPDKVQIGVVANVSGSA